MNTDNFFQKMSIYLAKESGRDPEIILFGLRLFFTSFSGYTTLIVFSALLGLFQYSIIAALTAGLFRVFSGGAHASSPVRCTLIGTLIYLMLGLIAKTYLIIFSSIIILIVIGILLIGFYVIYKFVPAETPAKPISSQLQKKQLRIISFSLLFAWFFVSFIVLSVFAGENTLVKSVIFSSSVGMAWQIFSLTPLGFSVVGKADSIILNLMERR